MKQNLIPCVLGYTVSFLIRNISFPEQFGLEVSLEHSHSVYMMTQHLK